MSCVQASACPRQMAAATRAARRRHALLGLLLGAGLLTAAPVGAESFDWRSRGVLFRITSPVRDDGASSTATNASEAAGTAIATAAAPAPAAVTPTALPAAVAAPSYLFATIHYGSVDELALNRVGLRDYLGRTRVLINEVSGAEQWRDEYEPYRRLSPGQSLRGLLGEPAFAALQAQLPALAAAELDGLKPWVAMSMLEMPGEPAQDSIDVQLEDWARADGLRIVHLENLPEQLAALDCVPAAEYALVLGQRLRGGWSFEHEAARTLGYYQRRELPAWHAEIERMPGLQGDAIAVEQRARHCLIEARNARWLPQLERLLRQGDCFVAVGAIHLTGEHGLLAQLSQRGFAVTVEPW